MAPAPSINHQRIQRRLFRALDDYVTAQQAGEVFPPPCDVVLSEHDAVQPDLLFVSRERSGIVGEANLQGAPDLVVEILSPGTSQYDRGYKRVLYGRHGVREYWLVDPEAQIVEVLTEGPAGLTVTATYRRSQQLASPLLAGLSIELAQVFG